jgi:hypothetical protein
VTVGLLVSASLNPRGSGNDGMGVDDDIRQMGRFGTMAEGTAVSDTDTRTSGT